MNETERRKLTQLVEKWRTRAKRERTQGHEQEAVQIERCAGELEIDLKTVGKDPQVGEPDDDGICDL